MYIVNKSSIGNYIRFTVKILNTEIALINTH